MDGKIDYSGYSLRELEQALEFISAEAYPENFRNLKAELATRETEEPISGDSEDPLGVWRSFPTKGDSPALPTAEKALLLVVFLMVFAGLEIVGDRLVQSFDVPAGRWLRLFYFTVAGCAVAAMFAGRHKRVFYSSEVNWLVSRSYGAILGAEIVVGTLFLWIYSEGVSFNLGLVISSFFGYCLIALFDLLLFFIAIEFPVRWAMKWMASENDHR